VAHPASIDRDVGATLLSRLKLSPRAERSDLDAHSGFRQIAAAL
jgi:hypothetical protein